MKIAFVTNFDLGNKRSWSITYDHIFRSLVKTGIDVYPIESGSCETITSFVKGYYYGRISRQTYFKSYDPSILRKIAKKIETKVTKLNIDAILSLKWDPIVYLETNLPIIFWHDATIPNLTGYNSSPRKTCAESIKNAIKAERQAINKSGLAIYSSEWAAQTAIEYYKTDPKKISVVPFGANTTSSRSIKNIVDIVKKRDTAICKLLFIGAEWKRKGGDTAVEIVQRLNDRGIDTRIDIIGESPPGKLPNFVNSLGFISKATSDGLNLYESLLSSAHFLISPTRADCTPLIFPESASFGLPVITTNVGGIGSVISNGKNGQVFPWDSDPDIYCDYIEKLWNNRQSYEELCLSSFYEYTARLNWSTSAKKIVELIKDLIRKQLK